MALRCRTLRRLCAELDLPHILRLQMRGQTQLDELQTVYAIKQADIEQLFYYFDDIQDVLQNFYGHLTSLSINAAEKDLHAAQYYCGNLSALTSFSFYGSCMVLLNVLRHLFCCTKSARNDRLQHLDFRIYSTASIMDQNQILYFYLNKERLRSISVHICLNRFTINAFKYFSLLSCLRLTVLDNGGRFADFPVIPTVESFELTKQSLDAAEIVEILTAFPRVRAIRLNVLLVQLADLNYNELDCDFDAGHDVFSDYISQQKMKMMRMLKQEGSLEELTLNFLAGTPVDVLALFFTNQPHFRTLNLTSQLVPSLFTYSNYDFLIRSYQAIDVSEKKRDRATSCDRNSGLPQFDLRAFNTAYINENRLENDSSCSVGNRIPEGVFLDQKQTEALALPGDYGDLRIGRRQQSRRLFSTVEVSNSSMLSVSEDDFSSESDDVEEIYRDLEDWEYRNNIEADVAYYLQLENPYRSKIRYAWEKVFPAPALAKCASQSCFPTFENRRKRSLSYRLPLPAETIGLPVSRADYLDCLSLANQKDFDACFADYYVLSQNDDFTRQQIHHAMYNGNADVAEHFDDLGHRCCADIEEHASSGSEAHSNPAIDGDEAALLLSVILPPSLERLEAPQVFFGATALYTVLRCCRLLYRLVIDHLPIMADCSSRTPSLRYLQLLDQGVLAASELDSLFPELVGLYVNNLLVRLVIHSLPQHLTLLEVFDCPYLYKTIIEQLVLASRAHLRELHFKATVVPSLLSPLPQLLCAEFSRMIRTLIRCRGDEVSDFGPKQAAAFATLNPYLQFFDFTCGSAFRFENVSQEELQRVCELAAQASEPVSEPVFASDATRRLLRNAAALDEEKPWK